MSIKRKRLSLKEKLEIIAESEKSALSSRKLAEKFGVGKTQIGDIMKHKNELKKSMEEGANMEQKRKFPKSGGLAVDQAVYNWVCEARSQNVTITGPLLKHKALEAARNLKVEPFAASNGWLDCFRRRHGLNFKSISGNSADDGTSSYTPRVKPMAIRTSTKETLTPTGVTLEIIFKFLDENYPQQATASIKEQLTLLDKTTKETIRFPTDPEKKNTWISRLGWEENHPVPKHSYICSEHFNPNDLITKGNGQKYLKPDANPCYCHPAFQGTCDRSDDATKSKLPKLDRQPDEVVVVASEPVESEIKIEEDEFRDEDTEAAPLTVNEEIKVENETDDEAAEAEPPPSESEAPHPIQVFFDSMARTVMQFPPLLAVRAKVDVLQVVSKLEMEMWLNKPGPSTSNHCTEK